MILEHDHAAAGLRHSPFSLAFEQAERELGERIGYPALVYQPKQPRNPRYSFEPSRDGGSDIMDEDRPIRDTDIVDRLNEQGDDIQHYKAVVTEARAQLAATESSLAKTQTWLTEESATTTRLRAELDAAHQHIGALLGALDKTTEYVYDCACDQCRAVDVAATAARAWLRRAEG